MVTVTGWGVDLNYDTEGFVGVGCLVDKWGCWGGLEQRCKISHFFGGQGHGGKQKMINIHTVD